jgi:hypothetical protein
MSLLFGQFPISRDPEDELFLNSIEFQQRNVVDPQGQELGLDSFGRMANGQVWRHTYILAQGGVYPSAPEDSALFDGVLNSACRIDVSTYRMQTE